MNRRKRAIALITFTNLLLVIILLPILQNKLAEIIHISEDILILISGFIVLLVIISELLLWRLTSSQSEHLATAEDPVFGNKCGDEPIDLANERFYFSTVLGSYFSSLLEDVSTYHLLPNQIESPQINLPLKLNSMQRIIHQLIDRKGSHIVIIAAAGGMGKSTLAARIVRCLYQTGEIDRILGDSAKLETIDISTGQLKSVDQPGFVDEVSFYARLAAQVGLTEEMAQQLNSISFIRDRLAHNNALIVLDNFETVGDAEKLVGFLKPLISRNLRAIITTREVPDIPISQSVYIVNLNPIKTVEAMKEFVMWHIHQPKATLSDAQRTRIEATLSRSNLQTLVDKSGGVPLITQLLISDVARNSWSFLNSVPALLPPQILNHLYADRWNALRSMGNGGKTAIDILILISTRQKSRKQTSIKDLSELLSDSAYLREALNLLHERFLVLNQNIDHGDFVLFPSLVNFIDLMLSQSEDQS